VPQVSIALLRVIERNQLVDDVPAIIIINTELENGLRLL